MPRSIWNGVISFGMVSIPVKLYTATQWKDILSICFTRRTGCGSSSCAGAPNTSGRSNGVRWRGDTSTRRDEHVVLTEEDFEKLPLPSKQTVELSAFVKAEEIDPVHYEKSYYLEPDAKGLKPFALLMTALKEKGLTGIAKIAVRNKEQLCALRPMDGTLILETLYYPDEIRVEKTELPDVKISDKELDMAYTLIELLTEDFQPEKYKDEYREALMQVIDAKLEGEELPEVVAAGPAKVTDIMSALRQSVEAAKKRKKDEEEEDEEAPARRRKAG